MNQTCETEPLEPAAAPVDALDAALQVVEPADARAWNDYVARHPAGSVLHRAEWEAVYGAYGLPVVKLAAMRQGNLAGVLALVWQKSLLFGNQLVSLPWFDSAGVLADDRSAADALVAAARKAADSRGGALVQLRQIQQLEMNCPVRTDKVLMRLALGPDAESLWKGLSAKVRNQVRKGQKSDLAVESGGGELLGDFYAVYSTNMRDLGSPAHHPRLFETVFRQFAECCRIHLVKRHETVIGAGLTIANGARLEIPWASSLREFNSLCVNHVMYWEILARACRDGFQWFHFGRSTRDSGTYHFKKQWGAEEVPLYWYLLNDPRPAAAAVAPPQESFGWAARIWRKLPLRLTRWMGPRIIAKVP